MTDTNSSKPVENIPVEDEENLAKIRNFWLQGDAATPADLTEALRALFSIATTLSYGNAWEALDHPGADEAFILVSESLTKLSNALCKLGLVEEDEE